MKLFFLVIAGWLMITNAWAEHEVDHRYIIRGYVLDQKQQGISNREVQVFSDSGLLASTKTDSRGYYSLHLHLHNSDNRRVLTLRAGSDQAKLRVTFDPTDTATLRVHEANFIDGEYIEGSLGHIRIPPWVYPVGGLLVLGVIVVMLEKRRKHKIKQKKIESSDKLSSSSRKSKKKRRRKR